MTETSKSEAPLGLCGRVVDEPKELICGGQATVEVLVRTRFGLLTVRLCPPCYTEHRKFYRENPSPHRRRPRPRHRTPA